MQFTRIKIIRSEQNALRTPGNFCFRDARLIFGINNSVAKNLFLAPDNGCFSLPPLV